MVRRSSFVIGLGLALLWWIGLSLDHNAGLLWFDAVGAVVAFAIGGLVDDTFESDPSHAFGPVLLGLGLTMSGSSVSPPINRDGRRGRSFRSRSRASRSRW
jgi:hypothetical protein